MPEYLAPGVYVEETSFRSKSIEGVATTTTGFVGPTRYGPTKLEPELITSLADFERIYGDGQQFTFSDENDLHHNYMWHAVRAFFEEGGTRLYVSRIFLENSSSDSGHSSEKLPDPSASDDDAILIKARFAGKMGDMRVALTLSLGQNVLSADNDKPTVGALQENDVVWLKDVDDPLLDPAGNPQDLADGLFFLAKRERDAATGQTVWVFVDQDGTKHQLQQAPDAGDEIRIVTLRVVVFPSDPFGQTQVWSELSLDPAHKQVGSGKPDSLNEIFALQPANRANAYRLPISVTLGKNLTDGLKVLDAFFKHKTTLEAKVKDVNSTDLDRSFDLQLQGGNDGKRPTSTEYAGTNNPAQNFKTGLKSLEDLEDISIVAAPGATYGYENGYRGDARAIIGALIAHAERMRYCIAVLDSGNGQSTSQVRALRATLDSKYAALYYPWIRALDPITRKEIYLPPSGFVSGIFARNDITRAVYKAPANEVVRLSLGFEVLLNKAQQDVLNPEGINCFRYFEGRGYRLWGARTISSDPEWKYVNLRRYFAYLERSIDIGTQWAVFEPNGEALWANVRRTIESFLLNEWQSGALLGESPDAAYFVRCDRSTMTQNDLDNGRLVCLIGVAALRPAEFVIFRIGQWTADGNQ